MLHRIVNLFRDTRPKLIPQGDHALIITAFVKDGILAVTYNGKVKRGKFDDNTLREMVYGKDFRKNANSFFSAAARLMEQIIIKK
jgi:hypothetical protein